MTEDEDPTFDLELEATAEDLAVLLSGVSHMMLEAVRGGSEERLEQFGELNKRLLNENPEAARYMLLEDETVGKFAHVADLDDETEENLGIRLIDGEVYDAENLTDIDIE